MSTLRLDEVHKEYRAGDEAVAVLQGVSFVAEPGESLAVVGPSGSGKSTLLHLVGTLDEPSAGSLTIGGTDPQSLSERDLARFRNRTIGFVFQDHHLLPQYSVLENVLLPTFAFRDAAAGNATRARELLDRVGLGPRLTHRPAQLSGGERQRVAVARALVNRPALLLCDEPTGSLDGRTAEAVADLLFELHRAERNILICVTHSTELAARCARRLRLQDGRCFEP